MDFMNRNSRPAANPNNPAPGTNTQNSGNKNSSKFKTSFYSVSSVVLLISLALLLVAVVGFIMNFRVKSESRFVAKDKMQAVFLNGGQVYFGKIRELNGRYVGLTDIYYLRVNQQVQPNQENQQGQQDISLVKLGCSELHKPQDQMIINREHVTFWENLKSDGQVAKAVESYKQANPDGQCPDTQNGNNQQSEGNNNNGEQENSNDQNNNQQNTEQ